MTAPTLAEAIESALDTLAVPGTHLLPASPAEIARVAAEAADLWRATTPQIDVPYGSTPTPFTLDGHDLALVDHVFTKAGTVRIGKIGAVAVLVLTFESSDPAASNPVAEVALALTADVMRKAGKLIRDTAFAAANAAERVAS